MGLTFEHVWATLQENAKQQKETDKLLKELAAQTAETDRQLKEQAAETDKRFKELAAQAEARAAETDKRLKELAAQSAETDKRLKEQAAETDRKLKEQTAETDRQLRERAAETDRKLKEQAAETDRQLKELAAQTEEKYRLSQEEYAKWRKEREKEHKKLEQALGKLGNKLGEMAEHLMKAGLVDKFKALGHTFTKSSPQVVYLKDTGAFGAEVDILLENEKTVMAVEVKNTLTIKDVKDHLKRLAFLRDYADNCGDTKRYYGAVAGMVISESARQFALKSGFFLIEPSGETAAIIKPPTVKVW
jgi:hypothetical protein